MKHLLISAGAAALLIGSAMTAHAAPDASSTITLGGNVAETCYISGSAANHTYTGNGSLANPVTAVIRDQDTDFNFNDSYCNAAYKVELSSANGAITSANNNSGNATGSFASFVDYVATAKIGATGVTATLDTTTAPGTGAPETSQSAQSTGAQRGNLVVNVDIPAQQGNAPLLAGDYQDVLTVKIATNI